MATQIPLRNIWLLFLYAANLVQFRDQYDHEVETARDLPDLVARLLTHVVEVRMRLKATWAQRKPTHRTRSARAHPAPYVQNWRAHPQRPFDNHPGTIGAIRHPRYTKTRLIPSR